MDKKVIDAIWAALRKGYRVELSLDPCGILKVRTVTRKTLKIE